MAFTGGLITTENRRCFFLHFVGEGEVPHPIEDGVGVAAQEWPIPAVAGKGAGGEMCQVGEVER
jgi:hypothetical protein